MVSDDISGVCLWHFSIWACAGGIARLRIAEELAFISLLPTSLRLLCYNHAILLVHRYGLLDMWRILLLLRHIASTYSSGAETVHMTSSVQFVEAFGGLPLRAGAGGHILAAIAGRSIAAKNAISRCGQQL